MKTNQDYKTIEAMRTYGGSFVKALAECLSHADTNNFNTLKRTFPGYFNLYEDMSNKKKYAKTHSGAKSDTRPGASQQ